MNEKKVFGLQFLEETEMTEDEVRGCADGSTCTDDPTDGGGDPAPGGGGAIEDPWLNQA